MLKQQRPKMMKAKNLTSTRLMNRLLKKGQDDCDSEAFMISRFPRLLQSETSFRKIFKLQEERRVYQKTIIANGVLVVSIGIVAYLAFNRTTRACSTDSDSKNIENLSIVEKLSIIKGTVIHQNKTSYLQHNKFLFQWSKFSLFTFY